MTQFIKAGKITRNRSALQVEIDGRTGPGIVVIGAREVPELLSGRRVDVCFVQQSAGREPFVGFSGEAWLSHSGRAVCIKVEGKLYSSPVEQVRRVAAGTRAAALLSQVITSPVIDADGRQREAIDRDLVRSFV
jgi:hypothetical protein